jgi:hypothetical protein
MPLPTKTTVFKGAVPRSMKCDALHFAGAKRKRRCDSDGQFLIIAEDDFVSRSYLIFSVKAIQAA